MSRAAERRRLIWLLAGVAFATGARKLDIEAEIERLEDAIGRMSEARKAALADPEVRKRMSEARKAAWADPEVRKRMSEASKAALADPEVRKRMSEARKAAWADSHPDLAALAPHQLDIYRTLRRKGCAHDEALREAKREIREASE